MVLRAFFLSSVFLSSVFAQDSIDTQTPFEKVAVIKKEDGTLEKKSIIRAKKIEENFELEKTEGGIVLLPASGIVAIIPQYPKKGLKYSLGDVRNAIKTLRAVPAEFAPSAEELKRWEAMEEILAASAPETVPVESAQQPSSQKLEAKEISLATSSAGVTLKNVIGAEELYQACRGPLGKEFIGKSVIVEGIVDYADSFNMIDGFTKPKNICLIGAPRPTGGYFYVKCEVRGPVIFLFKDGNLYARYVALEADPASGSSKKTKSVFYTVDDQVISDDYGISRIDTNIEFPLINKGNRVMIAQKMKIVGMTRMGDLELVGANIQKDPLSWDEIQTLSEKPRTKINSSNSAGGKYRFKELFIEVDN